MTDTTKARILRSIKKATSPVLWTDLVAAVYGNADGDYFDSLRQVSAVLP